MKGRFRDGLVFGLGAGVSFVLVLFIAGVLFAKLFVSTTEIKPAAVVSEEHSYANVAEGESLLKGDSFHRMSVEDQIKAASVIALAEYESGEDGRFRAVIREFLKRDADATIYYEVGDDIPDLAISAGDRKLYGDGVVIFFVGSPAEFKYSATYSGDRISGLSDIPLKLFRDKCEDSKGET